MMRTIFMTIPDWFAARNILQTDAFKMMRSRGDLRIVIFGPFAGGRSCLEDLPGVKGENVFFEDQARYMPDLPERVLRKMQELIVFNVNYVENIWFRDMYLMRSNLFLFSAQEVAKKVLGKKRWLLGPLDSLDWRLAWAKHPRYIEPFRRYRPDLVFSTNMLRHTDWKLVQTARRLGVPVVSMVANWDHLTKGLLPPSDFVIAWSEFNRRELMTYYGYRPEQIAIVGIPHQDYFVRVNPAEAREKVRRELGVREGEKLVLYTTARFIYYEPEIVEILCRAVREGRIRFPVHVHVRVHPEDRYERYRHIEEEYRDFVTFEGGGKTLVPRVYSVKAQTEVDVRGRMWLPDEGDMIHYAELLYAAGVAVNIASSVTLDAVALDKPTVNIAFDGYVERPFIVSTRRYFHTTHYKTVARSGGVRIARSPDELVEFVNMYLENPALDREGRRRIVEESGGPLDGKCGERIARAVLGFLEKCAQGRASS